VSRSHSSDPGARLAHAVPAAGSHTSRGRALSRRRKGAPLGAGDEGFRRHDKRAGVPVSVPLPLLRVLVQTWRGEPTTHLRARICPVNSFAAQNMPSCTGRSCNGRAGVGEGSPPALLPAQSRTQAVAAGARSRLLACPSTLRAAPHVESICPSPGSTAAAGHRIGLSPLFPRAVSALRCARTTKYVGREAR
jgi:hypothetical protein